MVKAEGAQIGDELVFMPDWTTVTRYGKAVARLRIYPGYKGDVVNQVGNLLRLRGTLKAWPADMYRRLSEVSDDELSDLQRRYLDWYYGEEPCPYHLGESLIFMPSDLIEVWENDRYRQASLHPAYSGRVSEIVDRKWVMLDDIPLRYRWREFKPRQSS